MKLIFAGTPEFAAQALSALIAAGHEIVLVLTQPDRPSGRGMQLTPSAVKQQAMAHAIEVYQPEKLKDAASHEPIRQAVAAGAEVMVVAAYGLILPQAVLDLSPRGCINIHASLLPRWRGAAPIQRAIEAGDAETGITIMQMDAGLDTGAMLTQEALPIMADDTAASLHDRLAAQGARLIVDALLQLDKLVPTPQPDDGVTYAAKITRHEAGIDWQQPADLIARRVRAFNPFPGATATLDGTLLKIWQAGPVAGQGMPGTVLVVDSVGILVACGQGALRLGVLQKPGGKRLAVRDFLAGFTLEAGARFYP
ncbi:MAG: methionyl-tRNA formyltransferase [Sterolibacterium sp.]|jgi:methionyl-tRNA formyltransferase|nr:methionyl-tRNA formyltransferase [Sterolibacterium sp.]MBP9800045.1 methionyl-tRNA formyltransferase [Sterolibacterium sp.]